MGRSKLDDRMKVLLRKIRAGETSFSPAGESDEARREFDRLNRPGFRGGHLV